MNRWTGLYAVIVASAIAAPCAEAQQSERGVRSEEHVTGGITVSWHGDPARGCADVGVCDIAGTLNLRAEGDSESFSSTTRPDNLVRELSASLESSVARVLRGPPDNPAGVCVDTAGPSSLHIDAQRRGTRVRLTASPFPDSGATVAGRCAGPLQEDLADVSLTTEVDPQLLRSGTATLDFSGRRPFAGGPFSGEVVSTLRIVRRSRVARTESISGGLSDSLGQSSRETASVGAELSYRVVAAQGSLLASFGGGPEPFCAPLDACGLRGTQELTVRGPGKARIGFFVFGRRSAVHGRGVAAVLRALQAGRLRFTAALFEPGLPGAVAATAGREGEPPCRDGRELDLPPLSTRRRARGVRIALGGSPQQAATELRTRCPGPMATDLGGGTLAAATIPWSELGARRLTIALRPAAAAGGAFAVTQSGTISLELRRTRTRVMGVG